MYARKNFGQILDKTALLDESYIIERSGRPMAALVPISRLEKIDAKAGELDAVFEDLINKIKGSRSKKLEKAIARVRNLVSSIQV